VQDGRIATPTVRLSDLGGVLVDGAGLRALPRLLPEPMAAEALRRKWVTSPAVEQFESGRCSSRQFAAAFVEEWGLAIEHDEFLEEFRSWVKAPYPGTAELLLHLRDRYTLACLSNTNAVHWESVLQMDGLRPVLERPFLSYRLGRMKPAAEVFVHVAQELGCPPAEIAFFDDGAENIDGATKAGLSAHQTVGPDHLRKVLKNLGLLHPH
jgi:putative hydrolase of the HAD superfamily